MFELQGYHFDWDKDKNLKNIKNMGYLFKPLQQRSLMQVQLYLTMKNIQMMRIDLF
ncbi:MAG: hypothetical protein LBS21_16240 [Clostridiales bacterium]|jgi:uncharacterized DUF497 family protein|nr:hypothetical protein [Clostridiales bacterium]